MTQVLICQKLTSGELVRVGLSQKRDPRSCSYRMGLDKSDRGSIAGDAAASVPPSRYALSARVMRRIAISHVRRAKAASQALAPHRIPLNTELGWIGPAGQAPLNLGRAFDELETNDAAKARALELHYFLGCTLDETARLLGVSPSRLESHVRFSLAWLNHRIYERVPTQRTTG